MSLDKLSVSNAHQVLAPYRDQITMLAIIMLWANRGDGNGNAPFAGQRSVYGKCHDAVVEIVRYVTGLDISNRDWNLCDNKSWYWDIVGLVQHCMDERERGDAENPRIMLSVTQQFYDRCVKYMRRIHQDRWKMSMTEGQRYCEVLHLIYDDIAARAMYQTGGAKYRVARGLLDEVRDYFKDGDWGSEEEYW